MAVDGFHSSSESDNDGYRLCAHSRIWKPYRKMLYWDESCGENATRSVLCSECHGPLTLQLGRRSECPDAVGPCMYLRTCLFEP